MLFWKNWTWERDFQKRTWLPFVATTLCMIVLVVAVAVWKCSSSISSFKDPKFFTDLAIILLIYSALTAVMTRLWRDMILHFAHVRMAAGAGIGPSTAWLKAADPEVRRRQSATHEPPGDTFTMVGIGFTFIGLVWATFSIDPDTIKALVSGARDADEFIRTAMMFGLSLCVGLMGSLYGVTLALLSRGLAAKLIQGLDSPAATPLSREDSEDLDRDLVELGDRSGELTELALAAMRQIDNAHTALREASRRTTQGPDIQSAIRDAKRDLRSAKTTIDDLNERAGWLRDGVNRARGDLKAMQ